MRRLFIATSPVMPPDHKAPPASRVTRIALWMAQFLLAGTYGAAAFTKLLTPIPELAQQIPWTGQLPEAFVHFTGVVDLTACLGLLLPALTRIAPRLTVAAALGSVILQLCATTFHVMRGELSVLPLNGVMLALSFYVLWGRTRRVPILARNAA
jgi:uncharacterized membrane protein YphA (DoxX/SURF4 family)